MILTAIVRPTHKPKGADKLTWATDPAWQSIVRFDGERQDVYERFLRWLTVQRKAVVSKTEVL